jgi:hypothetical protein
VLSDLFAFLGGELLVFYVIAVLSTFVLVIQLLLMVLGFDDMDGDLEIDDGANVVSLRSLTGFFGGFGWTGVIMLENGASLAAAIGVGFGVGLILMFSIVFLMRFVYSLRESGTIDFNNAIGQVGTVHVSVPPGESGSGQVRVLVQGRFKVVSAQTKSAEPIPAGRKVKVQALVDPLTILVMPLGEAEHQEV